MRLLLLGVTQVEAPQQQHEPGGPPLHTYRLQRLSLTQNPPSGSAQLPVGGPLPEPGLHTATSVPSSLQNESKLSAALSVQSPQLVPEEMLT